MSVTLAEKMMNANEGVGAQAGNAPQQFMNLLAPIHLPTLASNKGEDSPYLPQGHHVSALQLTSINDITPNRIGYDLGSIEEFAYLANTTEILTGVTICVQLAGLTAATTTFGGTTYPSVLNPRYVDDVLAAAIQKVEIYYGNMNPIQIIYPDEFHFRDIQENDEKDRERRWQLQGAGLSTRERVTLAKSPHWYYYELPTFFSRNRNSAWHAHCLNRPFRFKIFWRQPNYVLQGDPSYDIGGDLLPPSNPLPSQTTAGVQLYIVDKYLRFDTVIATESTKNAYIRQVEAEGDHGWLSLIPDIQYQEFTLSQATPSMLTQYNNDPTALQIQQVKTDTFTKYGYNMRFILRDEQNLYPNILNNNRWALREVEVERFLISNKIFEIQIDEWFKKHHDDERTWQGNPECAIYNVSFSDFPDIHNHGMGGIEFSNVVQPILEVQTVPLPNQVTMSVWLYCHNYLRIVLKGTQSAAETVQPLE